MWELSLSLNEVIIHRNVFKDQQQQNTEASS